MAPQSNSKYTLLVVDDEVDNLELLERTLRRDYKVIAASSGEEALAKLPELSVDLIITDQRMPQMTGIQLLEQASLIVPHALGIILTGYTDALDLMEAINSGFVYRYITKPWEPEELKLTLKRALESYALSRENAAMAGRVKENLLDVLSTQARALEAKNGFAKGHGQRTRDLAMAMGAQLGLPALEVETLGQSALVANIGDLGVSDTLLCKPGQLSSVEFEAVKGHAQLGAKIIGLLDGFKDVAAVVFAHHERLDGSGYPRNLTGDAIPFLARILAVADTFVALTSDRPHRPSLSQDAALAELRSLPQKYEARVVVALTEVLAAKAAG